MFDEKYVEIFKEQSKIFEQEFAKHYGYSLNPEFKFANSHSSYFWTAGFSNHDISQKLACAFFWVKKLNRCSFSFMILLHPDEDVAVEKYFMLDNYEKHVGRSLVRCNMSEGQDITEFCQNYYSDLRNLLEGELKNILIGKEFIEHDKWCGR